MKKLTTSFLITLTCLHNLVAQPGSSAGTSPETSSPKTPAFGIHFSGYVKTDIYLDTRQIVGLREGQFLLYPEPVKNDIDESDINAKGTFNMLNIQTRITGNITGPNVLGAKTSGMIEAEFFGNINPNINTFRLRHAFVKLNWPKTEVLAGQTWHPMFSPNCHPGTVSFNTGAMFAVFSRNPQLRVTQEFGKFSASLSALSQLDFTSTGPDGPSTKYLRNSMIPELDFQFQFLTKNEAKETEFLLGAGIDYLVLTPRMSNEVIVTKAMDTVINNLVVHQNAVTRTYKDNTQIGAFSYNLMAKLKLRPVTLKIGGYYGENGYGFTLLGGYAVKSVIDPAKGSVEYSNIRTMTTWGEVSTNGKTWQAGIFGGFSKNLGADETVSGPFYSRGSDIDYLYRISPRLICNIQKLRLAAEVEYTAAAYGKTNGKGYVTDAKEVANLRLLLGIYYFF